MSVTAALRDSLKANSGVAGLVGQKVYRDERPQGDTIPAVVILLVSDPRPLTFDGPQSTRRARVQIDCLASSRGEADAIAEAVIAACDGRALAATVPFESCRIDNVRNTSTRSDQSTTRRTIIDLIVWHHAT